MRTFEQLNQSMSRITGVPTTNAGVRATYLQVQQQLPPVPSIEAFLASHQTGIAQLAIKYCSVMVNTPATRAAFFPALNTGDCRQHAVRRCGQGHPGGAAAAEGRAAADHGTDLVSQPTDSEVRTELNRR